MSAAPVLTMTVLGEHAERFGAAASKRLAGDDASIGRSTGCDWTLNADGVSRLHAIVRCLNGIYFVEDRSTNGVLLNGTPIPRQEPAALSDGDVLRIDGYDIGIALESALDAATQRTVPASADTATMPAIPVPAAEPEKDDDGRGGGGDPLIPGAAGQTSLDPLSYLTTTYPLPEESGRGTAPSAGDWRQPPAVAESLRLAPVSAAPRGAELPEHWDLTRSEFAPAAMPSAATDTARTAVAEPLPAAIELPVPNPARPAPPPAAAAKDARAMQALSLFTVVVEGIMDVLRARAELKNSFRLPVTLIQRRENNPLKFAATAEEAVQRLLGSGDTAYLEGPAAIDDAMQDIRHHQLALLSGVRAAFDHLIAQFDPARFEGEGGIAWLPGQSADARAWRLYARRYQALAQNPDDCFRRLFGEEFAQAYEDQLGRLKSGRAAAAAPPHGNEP